jgi:hypothetical protein
MTNILGKIIIGGLVVVLAIAVIVAAIFFAPQSQRTTEDKPLPGPRLTQPASNSELPVAPAETVRPLGSPTPAPVTVIQPSAAAPAETKRLPMLVYQSNLAEPPEPEEQPKGYYAPKGRLVKCMLVNTVDSSSLTTPVIGMVIEDVRFDHHLIIGNHSEVHGKAQTDKNRERISAEGIWTFVLYDPDHPGAGRELDVKGYALDCEDSPGYTRMMVGSMPIDTIHHDWGITDASAGIRGVIIKTTNAQALNMFVAAMLSGFAGAIQGTATSGLTGQTYASPNASGIGGISGSIINPPAQGLQAVLNYYAETIMQAIVRDGFFVRVPAAKRFYVYVDQDMDTGLATRGASKNIEEEEEAYLKYRRRLEAVTDSRATRDSANERNQNPQNSTGVGTFIPPNQTDLNNNPALKQQADALLQQAQNASAAKSEQTLPPNPSSPTP